MADTYTFSIVVLILHFYFFLHSDGTVSLFLNVRTIGLCTQLLRGLLKISRPITVVKNI